MNSILMTGDFHGNYDKFSFLYVSPEQRPKAGDYLAINGDCGMIFAPTGSAEAMKDEKTLDRIARLPYTVIFVDGNHENFTRLNSYPVERWNGGWVHRIRPNFIHLMRGQVFDICGKKIFTMGGGFSRDVCFRTELLDYWKEELPCEDEYREAMRNLKACDYKVDYIMTHTVPASLLETVSKLSKRKYKLPAYMLSSVLYTGEGAYEPKIDSDGLVNMEEELNLFLDEILRTVSFDKWFFGHWHYDGEVINGKFVPLYNDIYQIPLATEG